MKLVLTISKSVWYNFGNRLPPVIMMAMMFQFGHVVTMVDNDDD